MGTVPIPNCHRCLHIGTFNRGWHRTQSDPLNVAFTQTIANTHEPTPRASMEPRASCVPNVWWATIALAQHVHCAVTLKLVFASLCWSPSYCSLHWSSTLCVCNLKNCVKSTNPLGKILSGLSKLWCRFNKSTLLFPR